MSFDLIVKNGTVLDGTADEGFRADLGVSGDVIRAIGNLAGAGAGKTIDAEGKLVTPGFIDIQNHSDSYFTLLEIPTAPSLVTQGITTVAVGQCGTSLAPLAGPEALKSIQKWHSLAGTNLNWLSFGEYLAVLQNYPLGVNVASLVGHSTLRRGLIGDQVRPATPEEIKIMEKMMHDSFELGAAGLSLGLVYAHEVDSSGPELASAVKIAAAKNKLLSVHLRSEGSHVVPALGEVIELAQNAGARLKVSHFKIRGRANWPFFEEAVAALDRAYQRGGNVFFDVYPYSTSWTVLYTYLPKWAYEGGRAAILGHLRDRSSRQKILAYLRDQERDLGSVFIATSETNSSFVGKTLAQIAANQEVGVEEALLNVLSATAAQVIVFDHNLSEENMQVLLQHPLAVIATDGAGYDFHYSPAHGLVHPRCFGAMPKFLSLVRDRKLMSWAEAIKKITSRPAQKLGLLKRGRLAVGNFADIVVLDPASLGSRASYENPYIQAEGVETVLVNGRIAYAEEDALAAQAQTSGRVLRI
ncbi:MAG: amidohydrolase family protein [Candidatus Doudnabacteria bacterium]|nr:amidohydrolase family protein [Candidatus Doudnabacteria bacterium]